jgi:CHAD domain-containing protein
VASTTTRSTARVAFEQYRYAVEIALPLLPPGAEHGFDAMKHFRDEVGAIQDARVLGTVARLRRLGAAKVSPTPRGCSRASSASRSSACTAS